MNSNYESSIVKVGNKHVASISVKDNGEYCVVKQIEADDIITATIWIDDEMLRLETGRGIWE